MQIVNQSSLLLMIKYYKCDISVKQQQHPEIEPWNDTDLATPS